MEETVLSLAILPVMHQFTQDENHNWGSD